MQRVWSVLIKHLKRVKAFVGQLHTGTLKTSNEAHQYHMLRWDAKYGRVLGRIENLQSPTFIKTYYPHEIMHYQVKRRCKAVLITLEGD